VCGWYVLSFSKVTHGATSSYFPAAHLVGNMPQHERATVLDRCVKTPYYLCGYSVFLDIILKGSPGLNPQSCFPAAHLVGNMPQHERATVLDRCIKRPTGHTHTHTDREQHPRHRHTHTHTHTHDKNKPPSPQPNTSHKHLKVPCAPK